MDYATATTKATTVTAAQAKLEVSKHGADWSDFIADNGERPTYKAHKILEWLGY